MKKEIYADAVASQLLAYLAIHGIRRRGDIGINTAATAIGTTWHRVNVALQRLIDTGTFVEGEGVRVGIPTFTITNIAPDTPNPEAITRLMKKYGIKIEELREEIQKDFQKEFQNVTDSQSRGLYNSFQKEIQKQIQNNNSDNDSISDSDIHTDVHDDGDNNSDCGGSNDTAAQPLQAPQTPTPIIPPAKRSKVDEYIALALPEHREVWTEWLHYRSEIRKQFKSVRSAKANYNRLCKLATKMVTDYAGQQLLLVDTNLMAAITEQSISQGWEGLFELKDNRYGRNTNNITASEHSRIAAEETHAAIQAAQKCNGFDAAERIRQIREGHLLLN